MFPYTVIQGVDSTPTSLTWPMAIIMILTAMNLFYMGKFFFYGWKLKRKKVLDLYTQNVLLEKQVNSVYSALAMLFFIEVVQYLCN